MDIEEISPTEAAVRVQAGAFLLDVRNDDEWEAGHAPEAHYITLQHVPDRLSELPTDRPIIAVCRAGGRSLNAAKFLAEQNIVAANLTGGMQAWAAEGLEVIDANGTPGTVI